MCMRVVFDTNLNFLRRLRPEEKADFSAALNQGKQKVGNTGHSILIAPSISFPGGVNNGVGNMLSKEGKEFVDFAKQYWGINHLQLLPEHHRFPLQYLCTYFLLSPQNPHRKLLRTTKLP